jgi:hypothetical protein
MLTAASAASGATGVSGAACVWVGAGVAAGVTGGVTGDVVSGVAGETGAPAWAAHGAGHVTPASRKTTIAKNHSLLGMKNAEKVKTGATFFSHPTLVEPNGGKDENLMNW